MHLYYNTNVKETLFGVVNLLEQIIRAIDLEDCSFFVRNKENIRLSEIYTLMDLYKNRELLSYSKRCTIPDDRIAIARKELYHIKELLLNSEILFLTHIQSFHKLTNDFYVKFELKNLVDKIEQIENKELQTTFIQKHINIFINKNATHNYTFYNEIIDNLKTMLSFQNVNCYDTTIKKVLEDYLKLENSKKAIIDSKDLLTPLMEGNINLIKDRLESLIKLPTYFETAKNHLEKDYHLFLLGFFQSELKMYHVSSSQVNYQGRYDLGLEPIDANSDLFCYILELKNQNTKSTKKAINQIEQKDYKSIFEQKGFKKFIYIAINFNGREFKIEIS